MGVGAHCFFNRIKSRDDIADRDENKPSNDSRENRRYGAKDSRACEKKIYKSQHY